MKSTTFGYGASSDKRDSRWERYEKRKDNNAKRLSANRSEEKKLMFVRANSHLTIQWKEIREKDYLRKGQHQLLLTKSNQKLKYHGGLQENK